MMRPRSGNPFLEIDYMMEETESWDMYVQALDEFLSRKYLWEMDRLIVLKKRKKNTFG